MIARDKELVVRRVEDQIKHDPRKHTVSVTYPWTEEVHKLTDNLRRKYKVVWNVAS